MAVALTPPPPLPSRQQKVLGWSWQIPMSQDFHQGNIFSYSDEFERRQQSHYAQQSRRDRLRVSGFEAAAASTVAAEAGNHAGLVPMEEDAVAGMYGAAPAASANNMLSEMFNFGSHADFLTGQSSSHPPSGYHRLNLIHHRPDFYVGNRQGQMITGAASTSNNNNNDDVDWSSAVVDEDAAAAVASRQHVGMNPGESSSTAMPLFFMGPQAIQHHIQRPSASPEPPMHHEEQGQGWLGSAVMPFGEGAVGFGGVLMERQTGPSLSLSSSALRHLEMRKTEEELRVRSQVRSAAAFFYDGQQQVPQHPQLQPGAGIQPPTPSTSLHPHPHSAYGSMSAANVLRNSKYARAAQELLEEFCSVGGGPVRGSTANARNYSHSGGGASSSANAAASSSSSKDVPPPLSPADRFECQRKKSKLLSMLDEVERRYNHYCEQMQMVVNSFDSVMGFGASAPYTALAQKAMSRHFRCLKDAIISQLKLTCELLGDKDGGGGSGLTKGETPKLRLIDQSLRQQRAFHQMGMTMEQEAWRPQRGLPDRSVTILRAWLFEHFLHPYPSDADKHLLARRTGLSRNQVSNWFINARVRLWKPMVEDMYQQESKEEEDSQLRQSDEMNDSRLLLPPAPSQQSTATAPPPPHSHHHSESNATETPSDIHPARQSLAHYDHLSLAGHGISTPLIIHQPGLDDDLYRRAAAAAAAQARSGDLSLTLGLRHAGGNPPDAAHFGR